jgi:glutamate-1-semialdehyde 2,1-aminomutase
MGKAAINAGVQIQQTRVGTMFTTFFCENPVQDWPTAKACDTQAYAHFFRSMLENGVYLAPSQFEAGFLSTAHSDQIIEMTIASAEKAFMVVNEEKLVEGRG